MIVMRLLFWFDGRLSLMFKIEKASPLERAKTSAQHTAFRHSFQPKTVRPPPPPALPHTYTPSRLAPPSFGGLILPAELAAVVNRRVLRSLAGRHRRAPSSGSRSRVRRAKQGS